VEHVKYSALKLQLFFLFDVSHVYIATRIWWIKARGTV